MELENQDLRGGEAAAPLCQNETPQEWAYHCVFQSQDLQSIYPEGILSPVYEECPTEHVALATNVVAALSRGDVVAARKGCSTVQQLSGIAVVVGVLFGLVLYFSGFFSQFFI